MAYLDLASPCRGNVHSHEDTVLSFAQPLQSETHWSDVLAVLIATDPVPLGAVLGFDYGPAALSVSREAFVDSANRPDIVLTEGPGLLT